MDQPASPSPPARRGRSRLGRDLTLLAVIGVLLLSALGAGGFALYHQLYSPSAFVERYLSLLAEGRAGDALRVPGVALERGELEAAGIEATPSDALLRSAALGQITDVEVTDTARRGDVIRVTAAYRAGGHDATTTFLVEQRGWTGVAPRWSFVQSPLAIVELVVRGSDRFAVNGFELDRRQVAAEGLDSDPLDPVALLVFSPGIYSVTVDTQVSYTAGVLVLADRPLAVTPIELQTQPTEEFVAVVQERVEEFLDSCATQQVLLPTACPFGFEVRNRIVNEPVWAIVAHPVVVVEPDGAHWQIPTTEGIAHIEVDVQSIFDGSIHHVSEDVPFQIDGTVVIMPDGAASIRVGTPSAGSQDG